MPVLVEYAGSPNLIENLSYIMHQKSIFLLIYQGPEKTHYEYIDTYAHCEI